MSVKHRMLKFLSGRNSTALSFLTAMLALGLVLGIAGSHGTNGDPPLSVFAQQNSVKEFTLEIQEWGFSQSKGGPTITVNQGDTIRITAPNKGAVAHTWTIDANSPSPYSVTTKLLASGESQTVEFVADKAGSFKYYCTVPGHRQLGMEGDIVILEAGASTPTPNSQHTTGTSQATTGNTVHDEALGAVAMEKVIDGVKFTFSTVPKLPVAGSLAHLNFEVKSAADGYRTPVQHIDPLVTISQGTTQVFKAFLHSHPGFFEINQVFNKPGQYNVKVEVSTTPDTVAFQGKDFDFGARTAEFTFEVSGAGAKNVVLDGVTVSFQVDPLSPTVGVPTTLTFTTKDTTNNEPISHIDALMRISKGGVTIYQTSQAHSHVGVQKLVYSFPEPGEYTIETEFTSIPPSSLQFGKRAATFAVEVKDAVPIEDKAKTALSLAQDVNKDIHELEPKVEQALKTANEVQTLKGEVQSLQSTVQAVQQKPTAPAAQDPLSIGGIAIAVVAIALSGVTLARRNHSPRT